MALNARQKLFVKAYLRLKNATQAAIEAGYSEQTARQTGSENLSKPDIRNAIKEGIDFQLREEEVKAAKLGMTKERWLEELHLIATANMNDYAEVKRRKISNGSDGEGYYVTEVKAVPTARRPRDMGRVIKKLSETKNGIGIELHSKQSALDTIGKHFGWLKEHVEMTGKDGGPQVIVMLPSNGRELESQPRETTPIEPSDDGGQEPTGEANT